MECVFRPAGSGDAPAVKAVARRVITANYTPFLGEEAVRGFIGSGLSDKEIDEGLERCMLMVCDGGIAGFVMTRDSLLHLLMVDTAFQRRGYGSKLLAYAEEAMFGQYNPIRLQTFKENAPAVRFYIRNGWKIVDETAVPEIGKTMLSFEKERTAKPLVDKDYLLERSPCKGSWTYTAIPEIQPDPHAPFSWVRVRGSIDGYEIGNYHLMPSGKGTLFLSVKADIRKKIKKEAGDYVRIVLYSVNEPLEVPGELLLCLREDAEALQFFNSLGESQRHNYVKWIYSAKTEQTKVERIAKTLARLAARRKFTDKP